MKNFLVKAYLSQEKCLRKIKLKLIKNVMIENEARNLYLI